MYLLRVSQEEECCLGQVSFYGGACAVALISLVFGVRPKPGVAVLGMLLPLRQLHVREGRIRRICYGCMAATERMEACLA